MFSAAYEFIGRLWLPILVSAPWLTFYVSDTPVLETFLIIILVVAFIALATRFRLAIRDGSLRNFYKDGAWVSISKLLTRVKGLITRTVNKVKSWIK